MHALSWLREHWQDMTSWLESAYPSEGCGLVIQDGADTAWLPCENLADAYHARDSSTYPSTSRTSYQIDPLAFLKVERDGARVVAIVHSHPDIEAFFSHEDIAGAVLRTDDGTTPAYPGVDYLVVSVRKGRAGRAKIYRFDAQTAGFSCLVECDGTALA